MSAYKTAYIRLGEAEYKKLREAEEQLRLNDLMKSESKKDRVSQQSIYENIIRLKKQNDHNFQNLVIDMEDEISRIENEASIWVDDQANRLQMELHQYRAEIQNETSNQIDELVNLANQQIKQKEYDFHSYWLNQEEKILSLENRWDEYENQAISWIHRDQEVLDFIYETYVINAIEANHLELQRQYLNQVIQQYNKGFFDIAASAGFQIFISLSNTRFQLEVDRTVQAIHYHNLMDKLSVLQGTMVSSQSVHAMDAEGNELEEYIDVDYWVDGRYLECARNIESLIQNIQADDSIDLEKIRNFDRQIDEFNNQIIDLVTQARIIVLASQLRFNVAQIVVQALESQGFFLEQANYEKGDFRESFIAKTCNYAGNEVLVSIDPEPGLDEGGKLHIQSLDANQITEHELLQRNYEIFTAIQENGIEIDDIREVKQKAIVNSLSSELKKKPIKGDLALLEGRLNHGRN